MWSIIICACRYCYSVHLIFDKVLLAFSNNGTIIFFLLTINIYIYIYIRLTLEMVFFFVFLNLLLLFFFLLYIFLMIKPQCLSV